MIATQAIGKRSAYLQSASACNAWERSALPCAALYVPIMGAQSAAQLSAATNNAQGSVMQTESDKHRATAVLDAMELIEDAHKACKSTVVKGKLMHALDYLAVQYRITWDDGMLAEQYAQELLGNLYSNAVLGE